MTFDELAAWLLKRERPTVILAPTFDREAMQATYAALSPRLGYVDFDQIPWRNLVDALGKHLAKPKAILWTNSPFVFDSINWTEGAHGKEPRYMPTLPLAEMVFSSDGITFEWPTPEQVAACVSAYDAGIQLASEILEEKGLVGR